MKLIPPKSGAKRQRLADLYTAGLPLELRRRYKVVITTGRYGCYARLQRVGPLPASERDHRRLLRNYREPPRQALAA